jgi:simple sugar transport system ATP-binding protein
MSAQLEARGIAKAYGPVVALSQVDIAVERGQVTCLLGDNGAGKSTAIKILAGVTTPDAGEVLVDGVQVEFASPRDALTKGIATVFQDLAIVPVLPVYRNFCMGNEPTRGCWPLRLLDVKRAVDTTRRELAAIGVDVHDVHRPIATLSGGQRQCVAIARAVHLGAKVLILDEPTSALGVRQSSLVLRYITEIKQRGIGVLLVTHNPRHAFAVGDAFVVVKQGRVAGRWRKEELTVAELTAQMSAGHETDQLD